jgi:hypothetical protein
VKKYMILYFRLLWLYAVRIEYDVPLPILMYMVHEAFKYSFILTDWIFIYIKMRSSRWDSGNGIDIQ